jgi:septation ring formation regulator EzrA
VEKSIGELSGELKQSAEALEVARRAQAKANTEAAAAVKRFSEAEAAYDSAIAKIKAAMSEFEATLPASEPDEASEG